MRTCKRQKRLKWPTAAATFFFLDKKEIKKKNHYDKGVHGNFPNNEFARGNRTKIEVDIN